MNNPSSLAVPIARQGTFMFFKNTLIAQTQAFVTQKFYIGLLLPLIVLVIWHIVTANDWIGRAFLPKPLDVITAFWYMLWKQDLLNDIWVSVVIVSQSFVYGSLIGILLGVLSGLSRRVELFFGPTLNTLRHIPSVAWLPLIVLWLGLGAPAKLLILSKAVFFPVYLNTLQGIRSIDKNYIELAKVLTLTKRQLVRKVILPAILPSIAVSLRYSAGLAWALVVIAEGLSGLDGLGFLIFRAQQLLITDQLIVSMVLIGMIGFAIDRGLYLAQQRLLRWKVDFDA
ncbi:MAG: ABC transporter permease [Candidatus Accumulibacter sp.]|jgi:sulfonate transport system permease protein|nr:ABC transporter permease [Accumulibacter sp.]